MTFEANLDSDAAPADAGWTAIGGSTDADARFTSTTWDGNIDGTSTVGSTIALRAVATPMSGTPTYSTRHDVRVTALESPTGSVSVAFSGGYFEQPYVGEGRTQTLVGISGTTSASDGTVSLSAWRSADGSFRGLTDAAVRPDELKMGSDSTYIEAGTFQGTVPLAAFDGLGTPIAVRAERGSDDVRAAALHEQTITSISVEQAATSTGTWVTLRVRDQNSDGVAGAEVRAGNGSLVGYTDGAGEVRVLQPNDATATYYANTTDVNAYEDGTDVTTDVTTNSYAAAAFDLELELADGEVFDTMEYDAGDIALQVVDQEGEPFPGAREITYRLEPTGGEPGSEETVMTDADGRFVVPFDPSLGDGPWSITYSGVGNRTLGRFVTGDAALTLTPAARTAASGGKVAYAGSLAIGEWPMVARPVALAYARGKELVPGKDADAGILVGAIRRTATTATTSGAGAFAVVVADAVEPGRPTETVGTLTATVAALDEQASATAAFGSGKGTITLTLKGTSKGAKADKLVATGAPTLAGERVAVRARAGKRWKVLKTVTLGRTGDLTFTAKDTNGTKRTSYQVRLLASARTAASTSKTVQVR